MTKNLGINHTKKKKRKELNNLFEITVLLQTLLYKEVNKPIIHQLPVFSSNLNCDSLLVWPVGKDFTPCLIPSLAKSEGGP